MVGISAEWKFTFRDRDTGVITREFIKKNQVTNLGLRWMLGRSMGIQGGNTGGLIDDIDNYRPVKYIVIGGGVSTVPTVISFDGTQQKIQYKYLCQQPATVLTTTLSGTDARIIVSATFDLLDLKSATIGVDSATDSVSAADSYLVTEAALYTNAVPTLKRGDADSADDTRNAPPTDDFMHSRVVLDSSGTTGVIVSGTEILTISITEEMSNV